MSPEQHGESGALKTIEDVSEIPLRFMETVMEGMAKKPERYIVIGIGFYLGWEGYDVMKWFLGNLADLTAGGAKLLGEGVDAATKATIKGAIDLSQVVQTTGILELLAVGSTLGGPKTAKTDPSPRMDETLQEEKQAIIDSGLTGRAAMYALKHAKSAKPTSLKEDKKKRGVAEDDWDWESYKKEIKAKAIAGCFGALTAIILTQPGFYAGVGEMIKGVGEIVPL